MKKLFILLSVILLFASCNKISDTINWKKDYNEIIPIDRSTLNRFGDNQTTIGSVAEVYTIEYRGHEYVVFESGNGGLFVIKDPDK